MRKELGLLMLFSASMHACQYMMTYTEIKSSTSIPVADFENKTWLFDEQQMVLLPRPNRTAETGAWLLAGIFAYGLAIILGITSLPSVSSSLSWREFRAIQSKLGWLCLIMTTLHIMIEGKNMWPD